MKKFGLLTCKYLSILYYYSSTEVNDEIPHVTSEPIHKDNRNNRKNIRWIKTKKLTFYRVNLNMTFMLEISTFIFRTITYYQNIELNDIIS